MDRDNTGSKKIGTDRERPFRGSSKFRIVTVLFILIAILGSSYAELGGDSGTFTHEGICDASGVVDLGDNEFGVADDEMNLLLAYEIGESGAARESFEISKFLGVVKPPKKKKETKSKKKDKKKEKGEKATKIKVKEVDIEGAARIGDYIVWIASHGRKSSGKEAEERMRLFATSIEHKEGVLELVPKGTPYEDLLDDFLSDKRYERFGLKEASEKAPKESGGLNIEAITDRPDGTLLIGFRSPLIDGKAIVAPLLNHKEVLEEEKAKFGDPILLDLGGRGLRGLASHNGEYLIVANDPEGDGHHPALFLWDGKSLTPNLLSSIRFGDFNPEAVAILPDDEGGRVLMLSDDGSKEIGEDKCKDLKDLSQRRFRSTLLRHSELRFLPSEIS